MQQKDSPQPGRPVGASSYDKVSAKAFGAAVREIREKSAGNISQEDLAQLIGMDRSHMGKIERGEHVPAVSVLFKIAEALHCDATVLARATAEKLPRGWFRPLPLPPKK